MFIDRDVAPFVRDYREEFSFEAGRPEAGPVEELQKPEAGEPDNPCRPYVRPHCDDYIGSDFRTSNQYAQYVAENGGLEGRSRDLADFPEAYDSLDADSRSIARMAQIEAVEERLERKLDMLQQAIERFAIIEQPHAPAATGTASTSLDRRTHQPIVAPRQLPAVVEVASYPVRSSNYEASQHHPIRIPPTG